MSFAGISLAGKVTALSLEISFVSIKSYGSLEDIFHENIERRSLGRRRCIITHDLNFGVGVLP